MSTWIVRANPSRFRIHKFIREYGFVEFRQTMKFQEGDIVYLYITAPFKRVEYKMVVERADIPLSEAYDDSAYSLLKKPTTFVDSDRFVRFKNIAHIETDELCYKKLLDHGFTYTMQSDRPVNSETEAYIESFFQKR
jgi:hypothetical protein